MNSFCILPFIHIAGKTTGTYRLCCHSSKSDIQPRMKMGIHTIEEVWNTDFYKDVRLKMLNNDQVSQCNICYKQEENSVTSKRIRENQDWERKLGTQKIEDLKNEAKSNNGELNSRPIYFDLRLGNTCNLKCRMCNSLVSRPVYEEWKSIRKTEDTSEYDFLEDAFESMKYFKDWHKSDFFWNDFKKIINTIEHIYITGGEPTLIQQHNALFDQLIAAGKTDIAIRLNSNLTKLPQGFLEKLQQFKNIEITVSIDGFEKVNDYIRFPSKFNEIESNFKKLLNYNIKCVLNPTIQAYNLEHLPRLLEWLKEIDPSNRVNVFYGLLYEPEHLSFAILSKEHRKNIIESFKKFVGTNPRFESLLDLTDEILCDEKPLEVKQKFIKYTKILDKHRNQSIQNYIPLLANQIEGLC